jgi:hypothetical protein
MVGPRDRNTVICLPFGTSDANDPLPQHYLLDERLVKTADELWPLEMEKCPEITTPHYLLVYKAARQPYSWVYTECPA